MKNEIFENKNQELMENYFSIRTFNEPKSKSIKIYLLQTV